MRFIISLIASIILSEVILLHSFQISSRVTSRGNTNLNLNRIFCDIDETTTSLTEPENGLVLNLNELDPRCQHIKKILKLEIGDTIKG
jgi:hypothetical protein